MRILALCALVHLAVAQPVASPSPGATTVTTWKGGARAAVSVTLDDGYANQWRIMPGLLSSRGFAGTFFIVTDWVDREDLWARWEEVAAAGHEIGSHGRTHA